MVALLRRGIMAPSGISARCRLLSGSSAPPSLETSSALRLYRFSHIRSLRALLRIKVAQLGLGVGVVLPLYEVVQAGGPAALSLADGAMLGGIVGGTIIAGSTLSWYCERLAGEISWRPADASLRVSTLTMWGHRRDVDYSAAQLARLGFAALPAGARLEYPHNGLTPWQLGDKTYMVLWGRSHVSEPYMLAALLAGSTPPRTRPDGEAAPRPDR